MSNVVQLRRVDDATASVLESPGAGNHLVQFYEDDDLLFDVVSRFLSAGLAAGEALVVIATPEHRAGFSARLDGDKLQQGIASGQILMLDARETLARFMLDGTPDRGRFSRVLEEALERVGQGCTHPQRARVRAYGEMVDLLWRDGQRQAAIHLEELWNEACATHSVSLLCAYVMANFYKGGDEPGIVDVCKTHRHVFPAEASCSDATLQSLQALQQRIKLLESENQRLRELDGALRSTHADRARDEEARFRLLVDSVKDYAIFMLDPKGIVASWNAGAERIKGYKASEIIGRHFSAFYPPEDIASGKCERELEVAQAVGRFEDEDWRLRKDGTRFWANVIITPLYRPDKTLVGFGKVTRDLTERVRAEQERLHLGRMEEAARRKDEFLGIMGHELRNPLAPLVTAAHMIRLRGGHATEKEMTILDRQLRQMTRIVSDLLDASRIMHDKVQLSPRLMEIGEVLADAVDLAAPVVESRGHELVIDVPGRGLTVNVDPERMAQVFGNLLNNAAKYTPNGGKIRVRAARSAGDVEVTIEDNGQGIAPDMLGRVFDMFTQGDVGLEREGGGLGIGLAVARSLVREHRGEIVAESEGPGRGSRFTVRVPHVMRRPRVVANTSDAEAKPSLPRRILIADDNRDAAELMQCLLEHCGHEVRVAFDGPAALKACEEFRPESIFLDIGLPGMNGYEVVKRIRMIPSCMNVRVVAVTGYAREEDRAQALRCGFTDHLAKPVDLEAICKVLDD